VIAWWLTTDAAAAVADLNISEAVIGDAGAPLVEAISASSSLEFITIGKGLRLPLKDNYGSDILDAGDKGIEAGGATVLAWWLTTDAAAAIANLDCSQNDAITGKRVNDKRTAYVYGEELEGWVALCSSLSSSSITSLNFSGCQLNSESLTSLTKAISSMAGLTRVDIRGAVVDEEALGALNAAAPPSCEIVSR
jgi:hypothetical protein